LDDLTLAKYPRCHASVVTFVTLTRLQHTAVSSCGQDVL